jgi:hypothetical protein
VPWLCLQNLFEKTLGSDHLSGLHRPQGLSKSFVDG